MPATRQAALDPAVSVERGQPVDIRGRAAVEMDGTFFVHQIGLTARDGARLTTHEQIRLEVVGYGSDPDLHDGAMVFSDSPCTYRTSQGTEFPDVGQLTFLRGPGCDALTGNAPRRIVLTLRFTRPAHVALVADRRAESNVPKDAVIVSSFGLAPAGVLVARGSTVDVHPDIGARRVELLAYVWELSPSHRWILLAVCGCALLVTGAVLAGWRGRRLPAGRGTWYRCGGAFMGALALGVAYAVIVPPFQAADEPHHFQALVNYVERPELGAEMANWARRMQFEEIRFHQERRFSALDRAYPGQPWTGVKPGDDDVRGPGIRALWRMVAPAVRTATAPQLLMFMRVLHALIFAAAVGLFVLLVSRFTDAPSPELLSLPLFLVPTLPFFGMHMSNYAPLLGVYVVLAAGVAIASWDGARAHAAGAVLGAALAAAIAFSRSAVPLVPFVTSLLLARIVLGDRQGRHRSALVYWLGFTSMLVGGLAMAERTYLDWLESYGAQVGTSGAWLAFVLRRPWLLIVPGAAALGAELLFDVLRRRFTVGREETRQRAIRWVAAGAAAALFLLFAASLWLPYPMLDPTDPLHPPPARAYVQRAVLACMTFLRFGRPDNLTSISFWGGFGWLETLVPNLLVSLLAASSGVALVLLLVWAARTASGRTLVWLACAAIGAALTAATYALSILRATPADVHGRYLLGLYLALLVIAWSALARMDRSGWIRRPQLVVTVAGMACLAVHAYCLTFILARYF